MTQTGKSAHVMNMLSDYVLDLLPGDQRAEVGAHMAGCQQCRRALERERNIGRVVQDTLSEIPAPGRGRMQQLMPQPPAGNGRIHRLLGLSPGWAAAAIMLLIIFSTMFLYIDQQPGVWSFTSSTVWSPPATLTETPTQTATRELVATAVKGPAYAPSNDASFGQSGRGVTGPQPDLIPVPAAPLLH